MTGTGPGTLKCVIAWPESGRPVGEELARRIAAHNLRCAGPGAYLVHTEAEAAEIRDWLKACLGKDGSALVMEFEKWSGYGAGVEREWLLARGH